METIVILVASHSITIYQILCKFIVFKLSKINNYMSVRECGHRYGYAED